MSTKYFELERFFAVLHSCNIYYRILFKRKKLNFVSYLITELTFFQRIYNFYMHIIIDNGSLKELKALEYIFIKCFSPLIVFC